MKTCECYKKVFVNRVRVNGHHKKDVLLTIRGTHLLSTSDQVFSEGIKEEYFANEMFVHIMWWVWIYVQLSDKNVHSRIFVCIWCAIFFIASRILRTVWLVNIRPLSGKGSLIAVWRRHLQAIWSIVLQ